MILPPVEAASHSPVVVFVVIPFGNKISCISAFCHNNMTKFPKYTKRQPSYGFVVKRKCCTVDESNNPAVFLLRMYHKITPTSFQKPATHMFIF